MKHGNTRTPVVACILAAVTAATATAPPTLTSQPLSDAVRVDGVITDWTTLTSITNEAAATVVNNTDSLILALTTSDPQTKPRLLAAGLIVYLDPSGKKSEQFGVRVPPPGGRVSGGVGRGDDPAVSSGSPTYVEVIGPAKDERHIVDLVKPMGFAVASADNTGTLLVEIQIPLRVTDSAPYAPAIAGSTRILGLGLVTPDAPMSSRDRGGPDGGGMSGRSGGMAGRAGGMGRGGPGGMSGPGGGQGKALKIWTTIALAG